MKNTIAFRDKFGYTQERELTGRWFLRDSSYSNGKPFFIMELEVKNKWFGTSWLGDFDVIEIYDCKQ